MKRVIVPIIFILSLGSTYSATITSNGAGGGDWEVGASWFGGIVPADGDDIIIAAGDVILIDGSSGSPTDDVNLANVTITVNGTIQFGRSGGLETGNLNLTGNSGLFISATGDIDEDISSASAIFEGILETATSITLDGVIIWSACSTVPCQIAVAIAAVLAGNPVPEISGDTPGGTGLLVPAANNPLPVEFLFLAANYSKSGVLLEWATATEETNSHFEVERSTDLVNFEMVDLVEGAGDSKQRIDYEFMDHEIQGIKSDKLYYRLKQVDFDGKFEYSNTVIARNEDYQQPELAIWPNPFVQSVTLTLDSEYEEDVKIRLHDLNGREVFYENKLVYEGRNDLELERLETLKTGVYILTMRGRSIYHNDRLIKR